MRRFTTEEDKVLLEAIRDGKEGDVARLVKKLDRDQGTVRSRIKRLKLTGEGQVGMKRFTLEEDFTIMDSAFKGSKKVQSLQKTNLPPGVKTSLSQDLKREDIPVYRRWGSYLKVWLLGYYSQTLNKEVRLRRSSKPSSQ